MKKIYFTSHKNGCILFNENIHGALQCCQKFYHASGKKSLQELFWENMASSDNMSLKKKNLHPHSMRHSTGVYLLKAKNDLSSIANWLGHADINTTPKYAKMDFSMKKNILKSLESPAIPEKRKWPSKNIVDWLESL